MASPCAAEVVGVGGVVNASSVELDGFELVAGGGLPAGVWVLRDVQGFGPGSYRSTRVELAGRGGARAWGADLIGVRQVTVEASIHAGSAEAAAVAEAALVWAWRPRSADVELVVSVAGDRRRLTGRPVSCEIVVDDVNVGDLVARCVFDGLDGVWESEVSRSVTVGRQPVPVGNLSAPLVAPLAVSSDAPSDVDETAAVLNDGTADAEWVCTMSGPLQDPVLVLDGREVRFTGTVAEGSVLVVESRSRRVRVDGVPRQGWVSVLSDWWSISPGSHVFELRATSGLGQADLVWSDTWL